jgi:hypothetical protein
VRIGIDVDGVVLDFGRRWVEAHYEWFGETFPGKKKRTLERATLDKTTLAWFERAGAWRNMPWVPGARAGLDVMAERGHTLAFLTTRPPAGQRELMRLESPWFGDHVYPVQRFAKGAVPCTLYIDDDIEEVMRLRWAHKPVIHFGVEPFTTWRAVIAELDILAESNESLNNLVLVEDPRVVAAREREVEAWRHLKDIEPDPQGDQP